MQRHFSVRFATVTESHIRSWEAAAERKMLASLPVVSIEDMATMEDMVDPTAAGSNHGRGSRGGRGRGRGKGSWENAAAQGGQGQGQGEGAEGK